MGGGLGIWAKLHPRVLFKFFLVPLMRPQLTLRSMDFRSVHPKTCFGGGCVPLGSICPGVQIFPFLPPKNIFNGPNNAIILYGSEKETPLMVNDSSVKVAY